MLLCMTGIILGTQNVSTQYPYTNRRFLQVSSVESMSEWGSPMKSGLWGAYKRYDRLYGTDVVQSDH